MDLISLRQYFETLTPDTVKRLGDHYTAGASFRDPFNEVTGVEKIEEIFAKMWESLDDPRFVIVNTVAAGSEAFLEWDFLFTVKKLRARAHDDPWCLAPALRGRRPHCVPPRLLGRRCGALCEVAAHRPADSLAGAQDGLG